MVQPLKPAALRPGDVVRVVSLASPVDEPSLDRGCAELGRLGYEVEIDRPVVLAREGFFAGSVGKRVSSFKQGICEETSQAVFCSRGGYGSNYLVDEFDDIRPRPKILCGFSDITSVQIFLWQKFHMVTFYGPMVASGLDGGADVPKGYDRESLISGLTETARGWTIDLQGETLDGSKSGGARGTAGTAEGVLLGGCLTLVETTLGTPWELDTRGAILVLEDRDMKPYQVDRALMHLKQAGKFSGVSGVILGDFPGCDAPAGTATVREVARRILGPLGVPIVYGAPLGHTARAMLTLPLGVRARLVAGAETKVEILEPAVIAS